ncbi:uncharacterized protein LOC105209396 [Zeugodacus cucurbitae]|uniref:uncharacterized protein LOC105209396 n=1 Tax=Zeugodacus cucurbitae TaxID=28588 RepID=UPI0023D9658B|nr:uncharacterized protein LOC105209396 [Zeugodacus cucurbitae]
MSTVQSEDAPVKRKPAAQEKDVSKKEKPVNCKKCSWHTYCLNDTCIQVTAWLLFTAGLCIIASTVYVGIVMQTNREKYVDFNDTNEYEYEYVTYTRPIVETTTASLNKSVSYPRTLSLQTPDSGEYRNGCREINCRITCMDATRFYEMLYATSLATSCANIDVLLIREQSFVNGVLSNSWIDCRRPVYELVVTASNITRIRSGAFNSPLFVDTYLLSLSDLQLTRVGSGALLGLRSLRYLIIDTPLQDINRAFFQPVQSTLMHLRLNCGLDVLPRQSIFGVSILEKLEYADLSDNVFYGPLTRQMFLATPNLRYLHITNSKITSIDADAFVDLSGVLEVLDLSENLITTLSGAVLKPLLFGSKRTLISLAYNKWNCGCNLLGFVHIYRKYRKKFLSSIFCQSPTLQHGKPLNELSFKGENCAQKETSEEYEALVTTINNKATSTVRRTVTTTPFATTIKSLSTTVMYETTPAAISTTTTRKPTTTTQRSTTTIQKPTIPATTNAPLIKTTIATSNVSGNGMLTPIGNDGSSSRSSAEDSNVIQLRCLHILTSRDLSQEETEIARDRRSLEIAIISSEIKSSTEVKQETSSEEHANAAADPVEPEQRPSAPPAVTRHPRNTTSGRDRLTNITKPPKRDYHNPSMAFYKFEVPSYNFELTLLDNNSVQVFIHDYNSQPKINIIWFSRQNDMDNVANINEVAQNIEYHCEMYQQPYLLVDKLTENTTYTFCMLEIPQITISPFNCLPLYVPFLITEPDNTWITQDDKQFTLGMLSLIFVLSAMFGGIIAYFGVKTYPELLEGSKNVLVVKRSEQESEYLKSMGSIKKEPLSRRSTRKLTLSSSEMPPLSLPPPPPFSVSNFNLERLSSIKSSSTLFESSFGPPPFSVVDDQYELPKQYNRSFDEERCVPNPYAMSPCSPPPLPKRNPSITSSIMTNRFSKPN